MQSKTRVHADPAIQNPDEDDLFDRIPDSIVLLVLNKLADVRSLARCLSVSRRFNALVPLVHDVHVKIDHVITVDSDANDWSNTSHPKSRCIFSHFLKLMLSTLFKPFNNLRSAGPGTKPVFPQLVHRSPAQVLKSFTQVRSLTIELPAGDVGTEEGVLLKWRAVFGSTLQSCVILGGMRVERRPADPPEPSAEDSGNIPESFYMNGGLKLRVVWTISSLIAASTRHFLLQPIVKDHPTLTSLVLTDADGQGTLVMGAEQLKEFREKPLAPSTTSSNRTHIPASNMKLRYAPYLELPNGARMQGATLIAIKPSCEASGGGHAPRKESEGFVSGAFDGPYKSAVKLLARQRTYLLEMNGF